MDVTRLGQTALIGWREKVANVVAERVPVRSEAARAAVGALFFALALRYVVKTITRAARETRR
jgi:hypothetical protein